MVMSHDISYVSIIAHVLYIIPCSHEPIVRNSWYFWRVSCKNKNPNMQLYL